MRCTKQPLDCVGECPSTDDEEDWKVESCGLLDPLIHEVCILHVTFTERLGWLLCTFVSNLGS